MNRNRASFRKPQRGIADWMDSRMYLQVNATSEAQRTVTQDFLYIRGQNSLIQKGQCGKAMGEYLKKLLNKCKEHDDSQYPFIEGAIDKVTNGSSQAVQACEA